MTEPFHSFFIVRDLASTHRLYGEVLECPSESIRELKSIRYPENVFRP